ncbi:trimeric intracellular cation channel family protein [Arcobacter sp. LA11]|uniref:trimeric intracellular cation channel family protein n=1 Tax=Arcobacter sp. LA11 TaxID=1898176 RepID=UPI000933EBFD|nr:trimeric intracellular cation channel family protein [Arcobacter sp. LA11]
MTPLEIADIIGIISFALSGFLIAVHYKLDILGIFISSFLTALGGGMIRDVIANKTPYVLTDNLPIILVATTLFISLALKLHKKTDLEGKTTFIISDAIGLVSFAITGALIGIEADFNFLGVLMLAFLTAVGGGTIRDILINKVPSILVSEFYGTVAIIVGLVTYFLHLFHETNIINLTILFIFGVTLRLLAYYKNWHLPTLSK